MAVSLICWALWPCGCQSDMLGFVAMWLSVSYVAVCLLVKMQLHMCMNNHVHSAPQLERKKEKNREERKKNHTL